MRLLFDSVDRFLASGSWWTSALCTTLVLAVGLALNVKEPQLLLFFTALIGSIGLVPLGYLARTVRRQQEFDPGPVRSRFGRFGVTDRGEVFESLKKAPAAEPATSIRLPKVAPRRARLAVRALLVSALVFTVVFSGIPLDRRLPIVVYLSSLIALWLPLFVQRSTEVVVGRDGVRVGSRFVPFGDVVTRGAGPEQELLKTRTKNLHVDLQRLVPALSEVASRLAEADGVDHEAFEPREGERDVVWRARVKSVFEHADFREAALSPEPPSI